MRRACCKITMLLLAALMFTGCQTHDPTATNTFGTVGQAVEAPVDVTVDAARAVLASLDMEIFRERQEGNTTILLARTADATQIQVNVRGGEGEITRVWIRIGIAGHQEASVSIVNRIKRRAETAARGR